MKSEIFWIESPMRGRLAVMPRPRGGDWLEDEAGNWRSVGVDVVVSLLTQNEVADLDLTQEQAVCEAMGMEFIEFPIPDRGTPASKSRMLELAKKLAERLKAGKSIAIHCRQGLGRAPLVAICVLILTGVDPAYASQLVASARGCPVPETAEQERWIAEFAHEPHEAIHAKT